MHLTPNAYTFLGLTALVAALVAVLAFALLRFSAAAADTRRNLRGGGAETALLSAALQEAVTKLKAQERATAARADASERLSGEIITSLTAGLLVVGLALIAAKRGGLASKLPFGTFLALGAAAAATVGPRLLDWYLGFF